MIMQGLNSLCEYNATARHNVDTKNKNNLFFKALLESCRYVPTRKSTKTHYNSKDKYISGRTKGMLTNIWQGRLVFLRLIILLAVVVLCLAGLACIKATSGPSGQFIFKQLMWISLGVVCFIAVNLVHYRWLGQISYFLFAISLLLLAMVLAGKYLHLGFLVPSIRGSARWLKLLPLNSHNALVQAARLQPSEIAKLAYILALAWYLRHRKNYRTLRGLIGPFALTMLPMMLIILEPDLGTTLLFPPILFAMLFVAGARVRHLLIIILLGLLAAPLFYFTMKPYQKERIEVLLRQNSKNPYWYRGPGYQLRQSKICIGSGGISGQGWGKGIFIQYRFLPDRHNDFIFALIAHQWGLVGSLILLGLYAVVVIGSVSIASYHCDPFARLVAIGTAALLAAQMFINIGMTMGLMPVTGMTLPFVSYGGSSLVCNFLALGLLFNIARHRPHNLVRDDFEFDDD